MNRHDDGDNYLDAHRRNTVLPISQEGHPEIRLPSLARLRRKLRDLVDPDRERFRDLSLVGAAGHNGSIDPVPLSQDSRRAGLKVPPGREHVVYKDATSIGQRVETANDGQPAEEFLRIACPAQEVGGLYWLRPPQDVDHDGVRASRAPVQLDSQRLGEGPGSWRLIDSNGAAAVRHRNQRDRRSNETTISAVSNHLCEPHEGAIPVRIIEPSQDPANGDLRKHVNRLLLDRADEIVRVVVPASPRYAIHVGEIGATGKNRERHGAIYRIWRGGGSSVKMSVVAFKTRTRGLPMKSAGQRRWGSSATLRAMKSHRPNRSQATA
jgi:hypothetical protein